MMKWRRKKPSPSSFSSRLPSLSRVLPTSWLSTFKRMNINSEPKPGKEKQKWRQNYVPGSSPKSAGAEGRFHGGDGDAFWRLSFGEETVDGKAASRGIVRSILYDSDEELDFPPSSCRSCGSNATTTRDKEGIEKHGNMAFASDVKKLKEFSRNTQLFPEMNTHRREKASVIKTPRMMTQKDSKLKKRAERATAEKRWKLERNSGEAEEKSTKLVDENIWKMETETTISMIKKRNQKLKGDLLRNYPQPSSANLINSNLATIDEDPAFAAQKVEEIDRFAPEDISSTWQKLKQMKVEELKVKNEKQRKSLYISREPQRRRTKENKVRVFSPRTISKVEICKIKALEDMKKAKLKMKEVKQRTVKGRTGLANFAVVKCSFDPEKDFRDSMIEMITEKNISQPEELEELLACYLTLNSNEYHDLIIKVFRQVWFHIDQVNLDHELQNEQCSSDSLFYY